jgi:hypothetical protein
MVAFPLRGTIPRDFSEPDACFPQGSDCFFREEEGPSQQGGSRGMPYQESPCPGTVTGGNLNDHLHDRFVPFDPVGSL